MNTLSTTGSGPAAPAKPARQLNLDALRCVSIFFVVVAHASTSLLTYHDMPGRWLAGMTGGALGFFSISPLLMLTGAMLLSPRAAEREPTPWDCYRKRLPKLVIPLVAWAFIYFVRNHYTEGHSLFFPTFIKRLFTIALEGHLWYMYMLVGVYLTLPFLRAMDFPRRRSLGWWFVGVSLGLHFLNYLSQALWGMTLYHKFAEEIISVYAALVVLGWLLHSMPPLSLRWTPVLLAVTALGIGGAVLLQYQHTILEHHLDTLYLLHYTPFQIAAGASTFLLFKQMPMRLSDFWTRQLLALSACSFGIYLSHILVLQFFTGVVGGVFDGTIFPPLSVPELAKHGVPDMLGILVLSTTVYLGAWLFTAIVRRIPYLRIIMP